MNEILDRYGLLLHEVDIWFARCLENFRSDITCREGCSACCRGLFDITLLDALYVKRGIDQLEPSLVAGLKKQALLRLDEIRANIPTFTKPWFLDVLPGELVATMMPEDDQTPCLLLSERGHCRIYSHRPMTCRLHGIPLFDTDGEPFSDEWCTLNFIDVDPEPLVDIRHQFRELFSQELLLFREITRKLYGQPLNEMDTIIPAAVVLHITDITSMKR